MSLAVEVFVLLPHSVSLPAKFLLLRILFLYNSVCFSTLISSPLLCVQVPRREESSRGQGRSRQRSHIRFILRSSRKLHLLFRPRVLLRPRERVLQCTRHPRPLPIYPRKFYSLCRGGCPLQRVSRGGFRIPCPSDRSRSLGRLRRRCH